MKNLCSEINMTTSENIAPNRAVALKEVDFNEDVNFLSLLEDAGVNVSEYEDAHEAASIMSDFMGGVHEDETAYFWVD